MEKCPFNNVWFVCRFCHTFFHSIHSFVFHKKEKHLTEFENIKYIVFEEATLHQEFLDVLPGSSIGSSTSTWEDNLSCQLITKESHIQGAVTDKDNHIMVTPSNGNFAEIRCKSEKLPDLALPCIENSTDTYFDDFKVIDDGSSLIGVASANSQSACDLTPYNLVPDLIGYNSNNHHNQGNSNTVSNQSESPNRQDLLSPYVLLNRLTRKEIVASASGDQTSSSQTGYANVRSDPESDMNVNAVNFKWDETSENHEGSSSNFKNRNCADFAADNNSESSRDGRLQTLFNNGDSDASSSDSKNWNTRLKSNKQLQPKSQSKLQSKQMRKCKWKRTPKERKLMVKSRVKPTTYYKDLHSTRYNNYGQFIFPTEESPDENSVDDSALTLSQWLVKQRSSCPSTIDGNKILLDPDPSANNIEEVISLRNPVSCKLCCQELVAEVQLKIHVKHCWIFNKKRHRYCTLCDKTVSESKYLRKHILNVHGTDVFKVMGYTFKCHFCSQEFLNELDLGKHKKSHKRGKEIEDTDNVCDKVNEVYSETSTPFVCQLGSKSFCCQSHLDKHSRTHSDERPLKCPKPNCCQNFKCVDNLDSHMKLHNKVKVELTPGLGTRGDTKVPQTGASKLNKIKVLVKENTISKKMVETKSTYCDICKKMFANPTAFRIHGLRFHISDVEKAKLMNKFSCPVCPKKFQYRHSLRLHSETHKNKEDQCRPFVCEFCGLSSRSRGDLNKHVRIHSEERPFKCTQPNCSQSFKMKRGLRSHEKRAHSDEKPISCPFPSCQRAFKTHQEVKQHFVTHTGERTFSCKEVECGKRFTSASILRRHMVAKHGVGKHGDYACEFCGKTFKLKAYLSSHLLVHMEEKPLKCSFEGCEMAFKRRRGLVEHERKHTGEQPYQCDLCGKAFARMTHFHSHMRKHRAASATQ